MQTLTINRTKALWIIFVNLKQTTRKIDKKKLNDINAT